MTSSPLPLSSLNLHYPSPKSRNPPRPSRRRLFFRTISSSLSEKPSVKPSPTSPATTKLPIREIPGDYGLPFIGPIKDRQDYFYDQGREEFFNSRIQKYRSTVFRVNMPPGPLLSSNPRVVTLLDGKSFPVLFDTDKVEKRDVFTGTYMPSIELTGGYRVLSYLDPSEPMHAKLKQLVFFLLKSRRDSILPEFHSTYGEFFESVEKDLASKGKADFTEGNDQAAFNFLARAFFGANPPDTELGSDGPKLVSKWVLFQLGPILKLGLPKIVEEALIHTFPLPPNLVKKDYQRLYDFFNQSSTSVLDEAEKMGISREEACHNLLFTVCFNSFGGMKLFFSSMITCIGRSGVKLHTQLAEEVRSAVKSSNGKITMAAMEQMPLMKSVVYESLRIEPPVPLQFGRAKRDLVIESHDAAFNVKEGEMLFGFQPYATKDPRIFDRADDFVPDRFVGEEGEKLLKHLFWSNGPETETPSVGNKQCAGKDFIVLAARLLVTELFLRYDSFAIEVSTSSLGVSVTITSLKRATF